MQVLPDGYEVSKMCIRDSTYTYQVTVQYEYKILNVTLLNRGVDYVCLLYTSRADSGLQRGNLEAIP